MDTISSNTPLRGIRVVEFTHAVAGPFSGSLLADFGAEVIKVERTGVGDSLRGMGPAEGLGLWFTVNGRNKKSVEINFNDSEDLEWTKQLVASADVMIENYRPGVLEKFGLGWSEVSKLNPSLVLLSISGFGRGGPYSKRPGFGKIAEAFSGATNLTGYKDHAPVHPGYSLGDNITGMLGAYGIMLALFERHSSGEGQLIDLSLYDGLFRMLEWQIPYYDKLGLDVTRAGTQFPFQGGFITEICTAADGREVVVSAATDTAIEKLLTFLRNEGLYTQEQVDSEKATEALRAWITPRDSEQVIEHLQSAGLVADRIYRPSDLVDDPHIIARGDLVEIATETHGNVRMPAPVPRLSRTPGKVENPGPRLGADNDRISLDR